MVIDQLNRFNELVKSCGNRYLAIHLVSQWARKLGQDYSKYRLNESDLLEWVIVGKCPYSDFEMAIRYVYHKPTELDQYICYVSDEEVTDEVRKLYAQSINQRKLKLCRNNTLPKHKVIRINILLRMAWFSVE